MPVFDPKDMDHADLLITSWQTRWLGKRCTCWVVIGKNQERVERAGNALMAYAAEAAFEFPAFVGDPKDAHHGWFRTLGYTTDAELSDRESRKLRKGWRKGLDMTQPKKETT